MSPKKATKAAALRGARPTPILSMLFESPAKSNAESSKINEGESSTSSKVKRPKVTFVEGSDASSKIDKGKAKEEPLAQELPWCDLFEPIQRSELAVHKKKVEQVEGWLREALDSESSLKKYRRILAISGPAGSGKSTLIRLLSQADQLNFQLIRWDNDDNQKGIDADFYWDRKSMIGSHSDNTDQGAVSNKLGIFLSSASRYNVLCMDDDEENISQLTPKRSSASQSQMLSSRRVILLEDLPNVSHQPIRTAFNDSLDTFLHQHEAYNVPLIVVLSESIPRLDEWGSEGSHNGDFRDRNEATLTLRRLIPESIRNNLGFSHIEFNAVAPTILSRALKRIIELARGSNICTLPAASSAGAKELIEAVVSSAEGDLRSAINTLQIVSLRGTSSVTTRGTKRLANGKVVKRGDSHKLDKKSIALISGRETSLVLFHTLGKILYNKRRGDPNEETGGDSSDEEIHEIANGDADITISLPPHMSSLERRQSKVDPEMLWRSMPIDSSTIQALLHQNYTIFCEDIEQCAKICDSISIAETVRPIEEKWQHSFLTDYYSFLVAIQGALLYLPSPISRNKNRKLRGAALFQKIKQLREYNDKLHDLHIFLREDAEEVTGYSSMSTLSSASSLSLLCEVLPLTNNINSEDLSSAAGEMVRIPWISTRGQFDNEEDLLDADDGLPEPSQRENFEGAKQVEMSPTILTQKAKAKTRKLDQVKEDKDDDEDDGIEEFD